LRHAHVANGQHIGDAGEGIDHLTHGTGCGERHRTSRNMALKDSDDHPRIGRTGGTWGKDDSTAYGDRTSGHVFSLVINLKIIVMPD